MTAWLSYLIESGNWLTLTAVAIVALFVLALIAFAGYVLLTILRDLLEQRRIERAAAEHRAYRLGRRDERSELAAPDETHDCHYPLIIETLGDGTKRRLDR